MVHLARFGERAEVLYQELEALKGAVGIRSPVEKVGELLGKRGRQAQLIEGLLIANGASLHIGNLEAVLGPSFACTDINALNGDAV